jgi:hypothetical protein
MRFVQEFGYAVLPGKEEPHQAWVEANEEALRAAHPDGTRLIGIFTTVYSSEKQAGFYRVFTELDSYAAIDGLAAAAKDAGSDFGRLIREHSAFMDYSWDAPYSNGLHKAVVDATVFDPPSQ